MRCLAALSHFMSWLKERGLHLYKMQEKSDSFCWTEKTQKALNELKALIPKLSILALPQPDVSQVISTALVVEQEEPEHIYKVQRSVYYISKILSDCETHYNQVPKLLYAILIMKCNLLQYFESHSVHVVTSHGLGEIIRNRLSMRRIV
jgi:hypothetical protein